jgi:hypothetical protein
MALATANLAQLRYIVESTYGTTPATGNSNNLRMTGESLTFAVTSETSKEIRADRQVTDLVLTGASASGGFNFEQSYKEYDDLYEGVLQGSWVGANDVTGISATITLTNTITASAGTPFAGIVVGQQVKFSGFTNAVNNQPFTVLTASATVITVSGTPFVNEGPSTVSFTSFGRTTLSCTTTLGTTLTAATGAPFANVVAGQYILISGMPTAGNNGLKKVVSKTSSTVLVFAAATFPANETGATTTVSSSRLTNGTTQRSFTFEKSFTDIGQSFLYRGMTSSKMDLNFASGAIVTGTFDFLGKDSSRASVSGPNYTQLPGTPVASDTYDVTNAVTGVGNVLENGVTLAGTYIKSLKLSIDNKLRGRTAIGTLGNVSVGAGAVSVTGTIEVYLADGTMYDKFINNTATSISWTVQDGAGNGYALNLPKVKYSDAKVAAGATDTDCLISMPFTALMDATTGKELIIDRFGA